MVRSRLVRVLSVIGVVAISAALAGLVGCGKSGEDGPGKPRIALVMKSLANEFFKTMQEGAQAHHREHADAYALKTTGIKNEEDVALVMDLE